MYEIINGFQIATMVLMVVFSVIMIIVVALQEGSNANLGAITGAAESFFGKNKAKSLEAKFKRWTMVIGLCVLICSISYFVLSILKSNIPS
ncbi:MAG: preprotein translocase subunit SecG [Christensenellaceae bacterium]|nr:preprotein translocase subunit SecG [Christensenellaceae bacterium]